MRGTMIYFPGHGDWFKGVHVNKLESVDLFPSAFPSKNESGVWRLLTFSVDRFVKYKPKVGDYPF